MKHDELKHAIDEIVRNPHVQDEDDLRSLVVEPLVALVESYADRYKGQQKRVWYQRGYKDAQEAAEQRFAQALPEKKELPSKKERSFYRGIDIGFNMALNKITANWEKRKDIDVPKKDL